VEALTGLGWERRRRGLLEEIEGAGGAARAIERGLFQEAMRAARMRSSGRSSRGESVVVGVNEYAGRSGGPVGARA